MHTESLVKIIRIKGDRQSAAALIKTLAKSTIGNCSLSNELLINSVLEDIKHFKKQIDTIDQHLEQLMDGFEFLTSIPGVGNIVGATILGEIGDIHRFQTPAQLLAFAGLDPSIYESGDFKSNKCRISKRGSKYLRTAIFTATRVACVGKTRDNQFRRKYDRKRIEGKHHNSAVCNVAKNMINTVFAIMKTEETFCYLL